MGMADIDVLLFKVTNRLPTLCITIPLLYFNAYIWFIHLLSNCAVPYDISGT